MDLIERKQLGALGFCGISVVAVLFLSQVGWAAAFLVSLGAGLLLSFGKPIEPKVRSKGIRILSALIFLWNIGILGKLAWEVSGINGTDSPLPGILLLLLCCYGVKKKNILPVGALVAMVVAVIYGILVLFALPNVEISALKPEQTVRPELLPFGFLPTVLLYLYKDEEKKTKLRWLGGALLLVLAVTLVTSGMGAKDFYTAAKSVNLLGTMERLEPFVAAAVTAGAFCTMGLLCKVNRKILRGLGKKKFLYLEEIEFVLGALICVGARELSAELWALGTTVCWGLIPVLAQLMVALKKVRKKSKNIEKNA